MNSFSLGIKSSLIKTAALDSTVHEVVTTVFKAYLRAGKLPSETDELESLLPNDGDLESIIMALEENFSVHLDTDTVFSLFAGGAVGDLEKAIVKRLMTKTADYKAHAYYMRNRSRRKQQSRQYRMSHLSQIRRKSRIYRAKVNRGAKRPRKRMGTAAGGFTYITR